MCYNMGESQSDDAEWKPPGKKRPHITLYNSNYIKF